MCKRALRTFLVTAPILVCYVAEPCSSLDIYSRKQLQPIASNSGHKSRLVGTNYWKSARRWGDSMNWLTLQHLGRIAASIFSTVHLSFRSPSGYSAVYIDFVEVSDTRRVSKRKAGFQNGVLLLLTNDEYFFQGPTFDQDCSSYKIPKPTFVDRIWFSNCLNRLIIYLHCINYVPLYALRSWIDHSSPLFLFGGRLSNFMLYIIILFL